MVLQFLIRSLLVQPLVNDELDTITDFAILISRIRTLDGKVYRADVEEPRKDLAGIFSTDEFNIGI